MNKIEVFEYEYSFIKNKKYVDNLKILVDLLPDYYFHIPASSSGKYHPNYALGEGGLVRHTKAAVRIANELYGSDCVTGVFNRDEKDLMLCALVLHDGLKSGYEKEEYTRFDHPLLMAEFIQKNKDKLTLSDSEIEFMSNIISSHMGQWNKDKYSSTELPIPTNKYQKFVHMCDYLASRKFLEVNFDK